MGSRDYACAAASFIWVPKPSCCRTQSDVGLAKATMRVDTLAPTLIDGDEVQAKCRNAVAWPEQRALAIA